MKRIGILGRKLGMTQVFTKKGVLIPVTVVEVEPNVVTQVKTLEKEGYEAIQLGYVNKKEKNSNKPEVGHFSKANTTPKRFLKEIRDVNLGIYEVGQEVKADIFIEGQLVDVTGISKGKGYQGVIKRYNQTRGPMSHGSQYHRGVGSLGTMRPMRVFKGKKLPGHMGSELVTAQNLEIVSIDLENNLVLIKGNVPGVKNSMVVIKSSVKNPKVNKGQKELVTYVEEIVEETPTEEEQINEVVEETPVEEQVDEVVETEEPVQEVEETKIEEEKQEEVSE
mgnify:CR=1 FL=1